MRLQDAAKHFDKMPCADAYAPYAPLFYGQFGLYDDSLRDGLTIERRILSVDPSVTPPPRKVILAGAQQWLIGDFTVDYYSDSAIRHKYVAHQVEGLATIRTVAETLAGSAGISAYSSSIFVKANKEVAVSADRFEEYNLYFSNAETITETQLIVLNNIWYLVRSVFHSPTGFNVANASELTGTPLETITAAARTYNPVTDTYTSANTTIQCIRIRWQDAFTYLSTGSESYERGDLQVFLPRTTVIKAQDKLTLSDGAWRVLSVLDETTYWSVHLRRM